MKKSAKTSGKFVLRRCWLDSSGREHKVIAKRGSIAVLNKWAKANGLKFRRDSSLFGGVYFGPSGEWYEGDIAQSGMKRVRR